MKYADLISTQHPQRLAAADVFLLGLSTSVRCQPKASLQVNSARVPVSAVLGLLIFGFVLAAPSVRAQGVPIAAGVYGCNGAAQAGSCSGPSDSGAPSANSPGGVVGYAHAPTKWADRWGAIADNVNGSAGIAEGHASKGEAERSAIQACEQQGRGSCVVAMTYHNQCLAVATGSRGVKLFRGPDEDQAKQAVMNECEKAQGVGACRIYYSGCSLPQQVQ